MLLLQNLGPAPSGGGEQTTGAKLRCNRLEARLCELAIRGVRSALAVAPAWPVYLTVCLYEVPAFALSLCCDTLSTPDIPGHTGFLCAVS